MIRRILLLTVSILLGGGVLVAEARQFYVSLSGSNSNTGAINDPWRTVTYATSTSSGVTAGDTIIIRSGNYPEAVSPEVSGTAANPIVIVNYPDETVSMDPGRFRFNPGVDYWKIDGLHILNSTDNGIYVPNGIHEVGFLTVVNCEVSHHKENGFCMIGPDFGGVTIEDCIIEYNGEVNGQSSEVEGTGICMYGGTGKIWARRNWIAHNYAKGISHATETAWQTDGSVIDSNSIVDNFESGIDWWGDLSFIRYNYLSENGTRDPESGEWGDKGLALDSNATGNMVAFNIIKSSGRDELDPRGGYNYYYNNIFLKDHYYTVVPGSPMAGAIIFWDGNSPGNVFRNNMIINMCSEPDHHWAIIAETYERYTDQTWSNNLYWAPNATSPTTDYLKMYNSPISTYMNLEEVQAAWPEMEQGSIYGDPGFTSMSDSIFTILYNSIARNAGMDVGFPYQGIAPDIGVFEYDEGNTPPWIDPPVFDLVTDEDTQLTYDLTPHENDDEQTGVELFWSISDLDPALATATVHPVTDILTITPVANQAGSDEFTLTLSDGYGGRDEQVVTLTVNQINDPPYIDPNVPDLSVNEDSTLNFDLTPYENDFESSGNQLTWTLQGLDPQLAGYQIETATDLLTLTPLANQSGNDLFTLFLTDGQGAVDSQEVTFTVNPINDPPWIDPVVPDLVTMEDVPLFFDLTAYEHDLEQGNSALIWSISGIDPALAVATLDSATDSLTIIPVAGVSGSDDFMLHLSDGAGGLDSQTVNLTVTAVNDPPWIDPVVADLVTPEDTPMTYDLTQHEHDLEQSGEQLTWSVEGLDPLLAVITIDPVTDVMSVWPQLNEFGADDFMLFLSDNVGGLDSQEVNLNIAEVDDPPVINPMVPEGIMKEDLTFTMDLTKYETDVEDSAEALFWSVTGANPALLYVTIDPITDSLTAVPQENQSGSDTLTLFLHDSGNQTDTQQWIVTVEAINDTPWIAPALPDQHLMSYEPFEFPLLEYGHDIEELPADLTWEIDSVNPSLFTAEINQSTKVLTLYPVYGAMGTDVVELAVSDAENAVTMQQVVMGLFDNGVPPQGPVVSAVPDFHQPIGFDPPPIDLEEYVTVGTIPFVQLVFEAHVWDPGQPGAVPELLVSINQGILYIEAPSPDWEGVRYIEVRVEDTYGLYDTDTLEVTYSELNSGWTYPQIEQGENWYIVEPDQTVHLEVFTVHVEGFNAIPEFVTFQKKGGLIVNWQDTPETEEFNFALIPNADNRLEIRARYEDDQLGVAKSVNIIEDSTPPSPPAGLSVREEEVEEPTASTGSD